MSQISIFTHELGELDNLVYVMAHAGQAIFIDPAWDADTLLNTVQQDELTPVAVLLTHSHFDHVDALSEILAHYPDVPVYISQIEAEHTRFQKRFGDYFAQHPDQLFFIGDGDTLHLADLDITVIHTPGHTLGSVCFYVDKHLLSGDTLFINGIGRCDFEDSDVAAMFDSVNKLRALPDETVVYPGHDYGVTPTDTLASQFQHNPYFLIDEKAFFVDMRLRLQPQFHRIPFRARTHTEILHFQNQYQS